MAEQQTQKDRPKAVFPVAWKAEKATRSARRSSYPANDWSMEILGELEDKRRPIQKNTATVADATHHRSRAQQDRTESDMFRRRKHPLLLLSRSRPAGSALQPLDDAACPHWNAVTGRDAEILSASFVVE